MGNLRTSKVTEQVADHLRAELQRKRWTGTMPGRDRLARELGVSPASIQGAIGILEREGHLQKQGIGRRHRISLVELAHPTSLHITILPYDSGDERTDYITDLRGQLRAAGFSTDIAPKTLLDLRMDVRRVAGMVEQVSSDAWIVVSGSRPVLEWFAAREQPAFSLFGRHGRFPIAATAPEKGPAYRKLIQRLVELGHHRIVLLTHEDRRKPEPGPLERLVLDELAAHGIRTGPYNLPDWTNTPEGFGKCLESLFRHTPPTALILDGACLFHATFQKLARMGCIAPEDVSLICSDPHETFEWCHPTVAHISWDSGKIIRRVVRWATNVGCGKEDRQKSLYKARFIEGGTVGSAPGG